jgi:hypothetical protein
MENEKQKSEPVASVIIPGDVTVSKVPKKGSCALFGAVGLVLVILITVIYFVFIRGNGTNTKENQEADKNAPTNNYIRCDVNGVRKYYSIISVYYSQSMGNTSFTSSYNTGGYAETLQLTFFGFGKTGKYTVTDMGSDPRIFESIQGKMFQSLTGDTVEVNVTEYNNNTINGTSYGTASETGTSGQVENGLKHTYNDCVIKSTAERSINY